MLKKIVILCLLFPAILFSLPEEELTLAVFDLESRGVEAIVAEKISNEIREKLQAFKMYSVIPKQDMVKKIQASGNNLDKCSRISCLIKFGNILNSVYSLGGFIRKDEEGYFIRIILVDVRQKLVLKYLEFPFKDDIELQYMKVAQIIVENLNGEDKNGKQIIRKGTSDIDITSEPPGGMIYIDGKFTGLRTPTQILGLEEGTHTIFIKKGNLTSEKIVVLKEYELKKIKFFLKNNKRVLRFFTNPSGATIYVNSKYVGNTPCQYNVDSNEPFVIIKIQQKGFMEYKEKYEFGNRLLHRIVRELEPIGFVQISTVPAGVTIYFDSVNVGKTPFRYEQALFGKHTINLFKENYFPVYDEFILTDRNNTFNKTYHLKQKKVKLSILGWPSGASVFVDNIFAGKTPLIDYQVPVGSRNIKISKKGYQTFKKRMLFTFGKPVTLKIILNRKSLKKAMLYSALIPGIGQIYSDRIQEGILISVGTIGLLGISLWKYKQYKKAKSDYQISYNAYMNNVRPDEMAFLREAMLKNYDKMEKQYKNYRIFLGIGTLAYLLNIFENYVNFPKFDHAHYSYKTDLTEDGIMLSTKIHF
jgi:hypothetical protein